MQRIAFFLFIAIFSMATVQAQSTASIYSPDFSNTLNLNPSIDEDWSFYIDEQNQIYFIDFETINVNLSEIVVINARNKEVMKADVIDLPVNTIFEIDFKQFGPGMYRVELRSFTGMIKKEVSIR